MEAKIEWARKLEAKGKCVNCCSKVYRYVILVSRSFLVDEAHKTTIQNIEEECKESEVFKTQVALRNLTITMNTGFDALENGSECLQLCPYKAVGFSCASTECASS